VILRGAIYHLRTALSFLIGFALLAVKSSQLVSSQKSGEAPLDRVANHHHHRHHHGSVNTSTTNAPLRIGKIELIL